MKKKLLVGGGALLTAVVLSPLFAAFEAHVINVTAKIENALAVSTKALDFGTVFPQEHLELTAKVQLSESFLEEDRVDDVEYYIRQKPKCAITRDYGKEIDPDSTTTGHVHPGVHPGYPNNLPIGVTQFDPDGSLPSESGDEYWVDCGEPPRPLQDNGTPGVQQEMWGVLPSLCEYISKDGEDPDVREDSDGTDQDGNDSTTHAFHIPWWIDGNGNLNWATTTGRLAKSEQDTMDTWVIDLAVPCFGNYCAQDWQDFVTEESASSTIDADDYVQDIKNEHKIFGCDLWVEVSEVSEFATSTTLMVIKEVVNDDGGNNVIGDFTLTVTTIGAVTSGVANPVAPGTYTVGEIGVSGYAATFSGDCDSSGEVTLAAGDNKSCTITNDDIAPNITLIKDVIGGTATGTDFAMRVDGTLVPTGSSILVTANVAHSISEDDPSGLGYVLSGISGDPECALDPATVTLDEGVAIVCTITNTET